RFCAHGAIGMMMTKSRMFVNWMAARRSRIPHSDREILGFGRAASWFTSTPGRESKGYRLSREGLQGDMIECKADSETSPLSIGDGIGLRGSANDFPRRTDRRHYLEAAHVLPRPPRLVVRVLPT